MVTGLESFQVTLSEWVSFSHNLFIVSKLTLRTVATVSAHDEQAKERSRRLDAIRGFLAGNASWPGGTFRSAGVPRTRGLSHGQG